MYRERAMHCMLKHISLTLFCRNLSIDSVQSVVMVAMDLHFTIKSLTMHSNTSMNRYRPAHSVQRTQSKLWIAYATKCTKKIDEKVATTRSPYIISIRFFLSRPLIRLLQ